MGKNDLVTVDDTFIARIPEDRLNSLIATIKNLLVAGMDMPKIADYLGMSMQQLAILQNTPQYLETIHENAAEDADIFKAALRPGITKVAQKLRDKAEQGDMGAIRQFIKVIGADQQKEDKQLDQIERWIGFLKSIGINPKDLEQSKKIKQLEEDDAIEAEWKQELLESTADVADDDPTYIEPDIDDDIPDED